jgi:hypothetical protein
MTGMRGGLKAAGRAVAGVFSAAVVARLGMPALGALVLVTVMLITVACWVIRSRARTDRVSRLLLACHGDAACLTSGTGRGGTAGRPRRRARRG